jgi:hypothetical protein
MKRIGDDPGPDSTTQRSECEDAVGFVLLVVAMVFLALGSLGALASDLPGQGYFPTMERLWTRITEPHKRLQCQNSLKQISLARHVPAPAQSNPLAVQGDKESK